MDVCSSFYNYKQFEIKLKLKLLETYFFPPTKNLRAIDRIAKKQSCKEARIKLTVEMGGSWNVIVKTEDKALVEEENMRAYVVR